MWLGPSLIVYGAPAAFLASLLAVAKNGFRGASRIALVLSGVEAFLVGALVLASLLSNSG